MKALYALSTLALIALISFFSEKLYIQEEYIASYSLTALSIASVIFWINRVSSVLDANATRKSSKA